MACGNLVLRLGDRTWTLSSESIESLAPGAPGVPQSVPSDKLKPTNVLVVPLLGSIIHHTWISHLLIRSANLLGVYCVSLVF